MGILSQIDAELPAADVQPMIGTTCGKCKYAFRNKNGELNPYDIVCTMWATDGFCGNDFCSRAEAGLYEYDENCIQDLRDWEGGNAARRIDQMPAADVKILKLEKWKEILEILRDAVEELEYYETHGDILDRHIWKYKDEALALIGEDGEQNESK